MRGGVAEDWMVLKWMSDYRADIREYTGLSDEEIVERAVQYADKNETKFNSYDNPDDYYRDLDVDQICRQMFYHSSQQVAMDGLVILKSFKMGFRGRGIDYGCGTAPVGFELLKKGHQMDFIDIDGAPSYEFLKWRVKKKRIGEKCGVED